MKNKYPRARVLLLSGSLGLNRLSPSTTGLVALLQRRSAVFLSRSATAASGT